MNKKIVLLLAAALLSGSVSVEASQTQEKQAASALVFALEEEENNKSEEILKEIITEYQEQTGVEVVLKTFPEEEYRTWIEESFSGGEGPDVYVGSFSEMTQDYKAGWLHNFVYLYDRKSAYDASSGWGAALPDYVLDQMEVYEDEIFGYPTSARVVRIFCNKELFEKAGASVPGTWAELMTACGQLKEAGSVPFAFPLENSEGDSWKWMVNALSQQLNSGLADALDQVRDGYVELGEMCAGMDKGLADFGSPEFTAVYELLKEFSQYWPENASELDEKQALELFAQGEAAMVLASNEEIGELTGDFSWEAIPIPVVTQAAESGEAAAGSAVLAEGEPTYIYGIRATLSQEQEKMENAVDFVQYLSSPEIEMRLAKELGRLPLAAGAEEAAESAEPSEAAGNLQDFLVTEEPLRIPFFTGLDERHCETVWQEIRAYLFGDSDEDVLAERMGEAGKEALETIKEEKNWNITNSYGLSKECSMCQP